MTKPDHLSFCPELQDLVHGKPVEGRSGRKLPPDSVSTVNNLLTLRNLLMEHNPTRTIEVGFGCGGSTLLFTATHRDLGRPPSQQHTVIDPRQQADYDDAGHIILEKANLHAYIQFHQNLSSLVLPQLVLRGEKYAFAYVDGSHVFEDVFVDMYFIRHLLTEKGIVAFDDSSLPHVQKVLNFIRTNLLAVFAEIDLGPYRMDHGRSISYRLAKFTHRNQLTAFQRIGPPDRAWNAAFVNF